MRLRHNPHLPALAFAVALAFGAPDQAAANLLANPGFEDGGGSTTGWTIFGSGPRLSLPATDNVARTGAAAVKIRGEFTGCPDSPAFTVGGILQDFIPSQGRLYTLSGWSYVASADPMLGADTCNANRAIARIVFFDDPVARGSVHEMSANERVIGDGNTAVEQWLPFRVSAPAPAGARRVEVQIEFLQPGCDPGAVFVDDLDLLESEPPARANLLANPSFDLALDGWSALGNAYHDGRAFVVRTPPGAAKLFTSLAPDSPSGLQQTVPAGPGSHWNLGAYALTTCDENVISGDNADYLVARLVFLDAAESEIGAVERVLLDNTSPPGAWTWGELVATAPDRTAAVAARLFFFSPSLQVGTAFVDDVMLREVPYADAPVGAPAAAATLSQNVPNPFNPRTRIPFVLAETGRVDLAVYDLAGRRIATLAQGELPAGPHEVIWDGRTESGAPAAAGHYRCVLTTASEQMSRGMVLLK